MFASPDGFSLFIPESRVPRLRSRLARWGAGRAVGGADATVSGLHGVLRGLVATSWPVGRAGTQPEEAGTGRFRSFLGDRLVEIVTRPLGWNRHAVLDLVPAAPEEAEVPRQGDSRVRWSAPRSLASARRVGGGGLYIIEKSFDGGRTWAPDYVGQTKRFDTRLAVHARTRARPGPGATFRVRVGHVVDLKPPRDPTLLSPDERDRYFRKLRMSVEHGVIRSLIRSGHAGLANRSSFRPLLPVGAGLTVHHSGGPSYLSTTKARPGSLYEDAAT